MKSQWLAGLLFVLFSAGLVFKTASGDAPPKKPGEAQNAVKPVEVPADLPAGAIARLGRPRGQTLFYQDRIKVAAFSADSKRIATANDKPGISIWDVESGKKITNFLVTVGQGAAETHPVLFALYFAPDGKQIAWVCAGFLGVSDLATGREIWTEKDNGFPFNWTSNGKYVITVGGYGHHCYAGVLDAKTGKLVHKLGEGDGKWGFNGRGALMLSDDGTTLAVLAETKRKVDIGKEWDRSQAHRIEIWDVATGKLRKTFDQPDGSITLFISGISPDGKTVKYGAAVPDRQPGSQKALYIFLDTQTGKELPDLVRDPPSWSKFSPYWVYGTGVLQSPDGKLRVTFAEPSGLNVFDVATDRGLPSYDGIRSTVRDLVFDAAGKTLLSADSFYVCEWDVATRTVKKRYGNSPWPNLDSPWPNINFPGLRKLTADRKLTVDGKWAAEVQGAIHIVDTSNDKVVQKCVGHTSNINSLSFSRDGSRLLSASHSEFLPLMDELERNERIYRPFPKMPHSDESVRLWDVQTGKQLRLWNLSVAIVVLAPDGKTMYAVETLRPKLLDLRRRPGQPGPLDSEDIIKAPSPDEKKKLDDEIIKALKGQPPDGKKMEVGSKLRRFDTDTGKELAALAGHTGNIQALQISQDGSRIAARDDRGVVLLWDAATGKELKRLTGCTAMALSGDGRVLATSLDDWTILLWDVAQGK